jgi:hypothetical protein
MVLPDMVERDEVREQHERSAQHHVSAGGDEHNKRGQSQKRRLPDLDKRGPALGRPAMSQITDDHVSQVEKGEIARIQSSAQSHRSEIARDEFTPGPGVGCEVGRIERDQDDAGRAQTDPARSPPPQQGGRQNQRKHLEQHRGRETGCGCGSFSRA